MSPADRRKYVRQSLIGRHREMLVRIKQFRDDIEAFNFFNPDEPVPPDAELDRAERQVRLDLQLLEADA